jgi:hypothetical protein
LKLTFLAHPIADESQNPYQTEQTRQSGGTNHRYLSEIKKKQPGNPKDQPIETNVMQTNLNNTEWGSTAIKRGPTINKGTGIIVRNEQTDDKFRRAIPKQETIPANEIVMAKIVVECLKQTDSQEVRIFARNLFT